MTTNLETYRQINREIDPWTVRGEAWSSAIQNASDTINENSLQQIIKLYEIVISEYDDASELVMAALTVSTMQGILCSANEWKLTKRDIAWFARRGITS